MEKENRQLKALVLILVGKLEKCTKGPQQSTVQKKDARVVITSSMEFSLKTSIFDRYNFSWRPTTEAKHITMWIDNFKKRNNVQEGIYQLQLDIETKVLTLTKFKRNTKTKMTIVPGDSSSRWFDEFEWTMKQVAIEQGLEDSSRRCVQSNYARIVEFCTACKEAL